MHRYESSVLDALKKSGKSSLSELVSASGIGRDEVMWALENLKEKGMVSISYEESGRISLSKEGKEYAKDGLPEELLVKNLVKGSLKAADLDGSQRIGLQWGKKLGLIDIDGGMLRLTAEGRRAATAGIAMGDLLRSISKNPDDIRTAMHDGSLLTELSRRGLVEVRKQSVISSVELTGEGRKHVDKEDTDLIEEVDRAVISSGSWKTHGLKKYDVMVDVERQVPAMKHPLKRLIDKLKDAYVGMGYTEISGPAVESSFWVFDSLFVPQDHPARDAQDTFYVSNLKNENFGKLAYVNTVKKAHKKGWHFEWREDIAGQMLLRTHTTSVSSRYLYKIIDALKKNPEDYTLPIKLFSVGRVFRNETVDYRHLADFYQHDGMVIGRNLTLSNLFDELTKLYGSLGVKIKFKPSYFPFVEPGVEFMAYYEGRDEWIELGGAGMIREEITGVSRKKISVLAWGPGLDRTMLIKDRSISNISELYNNGVGWLRSRRVV